MVKSAKVHLTSTTGVKLLGETSISQTLQDGDQLYLVIPGNVRVKAHKFGMCFAAIKPDGTVMVWGHPNYCHMNTKTRECLNDVQDVFVSERAFAFLKSDGKVVVTGDEFGGGKFVGPDVENLARSEQMDREEEHVELMSISDLITIDAGLCVTSCLWVLPHQHEFYDQFLRISSGTEFLSFKLVSSILFKR